MKSYKRVASAVLGMAMAASCMVPITAFAAEDFQQPTDNTVIANHPNDETMLHSTPVYRIGSKSFYKVNDDGSVTYADQDTAGFKAVPAAYIMGNPYNTVGEYGIYTTKCSPGWPFVLVESAFSCYDRRVTVRQKQAGALRQDFRLPGSKRQGELEPRYC